MLNSWKEMYVMETAQGSQRFIKQTIFQETL